MVWENKFCEFCFQAMNQQEAEEIANDWKYDNIYSFYDMFYSQGE